MPLTHEIIGDGLEVKLNISGRFDFSLHREFREASKMGNGASSRYEIDLSHVEYMDSAALGMLLLLREEAGGDQSQVKLVGARNDVRRVLEVSNFQKMFEII